eukprot:3617241-Rhodomonas_salina.3
MLREEQGALRGRAVRLGRSPGFIFNNYMSASAVPEERAAEPRVRLSLRQRVRVMSARTRPPRRRARGSARRCPRGPRFRGSRSWSWRRCSAARSPSTPALHSRRCEPTSVKSEIEQFDNVGSVKESGWQCIAQAL